MEQRSQVFVHSYVLYKRLVSNQVSHRCDGGLINPLDLAEKEGAHLDAEHKVPRVRGNSRDRQQA